MELFGDSDEVAEVADLGDAEKVSQRAQQGLGRMRIAISYLTA
jgi:hypothetical protein